MLKPNHNLRVDPPSHWWIVIRQQAAAPSYAALACLVDFADAWKKRIFAGQAGARVCDVDNDGFWIPRQHYHYRTNPDFWIGRLAFFELTEKQPRQLKGSNRGAW